MLCLIIPFRVIYAVKALWPQWIQTNTHHPHNAQPKRPIIVTSYINPTLTGTGTLPFRLSQRSAANTATSAEYWSCSWQFSTHLRFYCLSEAFFPIGKIIEL